MKSPPLLPRLAMADDFLGPVNLCVIKHNNGFLVDAKRHKSSRLFDCFRSDFSTDREIGIDCQVVSYAEKYLTAKGLNDATLRQAVRVNAQTPFLHLSRREFKETGDTLFTESGMTVTLERIVYPNAERNFTMIHLSVTKADNYFGHQYLYDTFESPAVKDLGLNKLLGWNNLFVRLPMIGSDKSNRLIFNPAS